MQIRSLERFRSLALGALAPFVFVLLAPLGFALWVGHEDLPLERILPQLERRVADHPDDVHARYLLGRAHGAAFARGISAVCMNRDSRLTDGRTPEGCGAIAPSATQRTPSYASKDLAQLTPEQSLSHLSESLRQLSRAVELAGDDALYHLGLACSLDVGAHLAAQVDSLVIAASLTGSLAPEESSAASARIEALGGKEAAAADAEKRLATLGQRVLAQLSSHRADADPRRQQAVARLLTSAWRELATVHYERAFALAFDRDRQQDLLLINLRSSLVSYEAASSYIRLLEDRGARSGAETRRLAEVRAGLDVLNKIPTWVTPLLVPERGDATLGALFDGASASFDLSGAGLQQTWPWPTAQASFLVWDPECTGQITSGRQLFGSATWWMFFEDGYRALEALDEDGDGWLVGRELEGLALWRDANRNGVSEPGEVASPASRGLAALATRADGADGLSPTCSRGALFADGSARPTFDWVASPLPPAP